MLRSTVPSISPPRSSPNRKHYIIETISQTKTFSNYLGIGVDAQVASNFHSMREELPGLFWSSTVNLLYYGFWGLVEMLVRSSAELPQRVRIYCDGQHYKLASGIEGIVLANIPSWSAGADLWREPGNVLVLEHEHGAQLENQHRPVFPGTEEDEDSPRDDENGPPPSTRSSGTAVPVRAGGSRFELGGGGGTSPASIGDNSPSDGLLDVALLRGADHIALIVGGLDRGIRLCQSGEIEIEIVNPQTHKPIPIQVLGFVGFSDFAKILCSRRITPGRSPGLCHSTSRPD